MNVAIVHEALSAHARADESDVLDQAEAVADALEELGHDHRSVTFSGDVTTLVDRLRSIPADVVFNLVESVDGSGQGVDIVPAALTAAGMPFTGSGARAMSMAGSKLSTKALLGEHGLPTPDWVAPTRGAHGSATKSGRYIVKSVWEHGSLGIEADSVVVVSKVDELLEEIEQRRSRLGGEAFAEAYVHGREFNLALLADGLDVEHLPAAEIVFAAGSSDAVQIVGYRAKWEPGSAEDLGTPRRFRVSPGDFELVAEMRRLAKAVWHAFGLAGYARVDFRVDEAGDPWIIDVNTNPCLSRDAGFAAAVLEADLSFATAIERILDAAFVTRV